MKIHITVDKDDCSVSDLLTLVRKHVGSILYAKHMDDVYFSASRLLHDLRELEQNLKAVIEEAPKGNVRVNFSQGAGFSSSRLFYYVLPVTQGVESTGGQYVLGTIGDDHQPKAERDYGMKADRFSIDPRPQTEHTGGSVNYYKVTVDKPVNPDLTPYTAECLDIALKLGMTIEEFNVFKAIWRTAAERTLGLAKDGNNAKYDAEKMVFFSEVNLRRYV